MSCFFLCLVVVVVFFKVILDYLDALESHIVPHKRSLCPTSGELGSGHPSSMQYVCLSCLKCFTRNLWWNGGNGTTIYSSNNKSLQPATK